METYVTRALAAFNSLGKHASDAARMQAALAAAEPPDLETPRMLVLSTSHITKNTLGDLAPYSSQGPLRFSKGVYGWFIPLETGSQDEKRWLAYPDLAAIRSLAEANGCTWIMLDRDADVVDGLQTYEW